MMLEQTVEGTKYRRYTDISISNKPGQRPSVHIIAADFIRIGDASPPVQLDRQDMCFDFNPEGVFPLRNPLTDELTGQTITQAEVYGILYSICRAVDGA